MKDREYHIGPGAVSLLLVIVVVSLSVLGLLALISGRSDYKLTERAVSFAAAENTASVSAEKTAAELDMILMQCAAEAVDNEAYLAAIKENIPLNMRMNGTEISWEEYAEGGRMLYCAAEILPLGENVRYKWTTRMFIAQEEQFIG